MCVQVPCVYLLGTASPVIRNKYYCIDEVDFIFVRNYEDQCTKKKCMFWIPMRCLFLTCTENSFYSEHTYKIKGCVFYYLLKDISYLERRSHGCEYPILSSPLLEVNCPCAPYISFIPRTSFPLTGHLFYIKTTLTSRLLCWAQYSISKVFTYIIVLMNWLHWIVKLSCYWWKLITFHWWSLYRYHCIDNSVVHPDPS